MSNQLFYDVISAPLFERGCTIRVFSNAQCNCLFNRELFALNDDGQCRRLVRSSDGLLTIRLHRLRRRKLSVMARRATEPSSFWNNKFRRNNEFGGLRK